VKTASRSARQRTHHDKLLRKLDWRPGEQPSGGPVDAIIVPASRRAQHLSGLVDLAARCGATLVVFTSHQCDIDEAAALVAGTPGSGRAVLAEIPSGEVPKVDTPSGEVLDLGRMATSDGEFRRLDGNRSSNLSVKRNLGLLLARYRGWRKIMFLDDDLIGVTQEHVARVAHHLATNRFAGLKTLQFPDNSVVCHANRLVGHPQGIFVSGAGLGVNTGDAINLQIFPDVYNEDWFAFADEAATAGVAHVGDVRQLSFNPFENPQRATFEEFGDLIAEGLYALFNDGCGLHRATESYWADFIDVRRQFVKDLRGQLANNDTHEWAQARTSLREVLHRLGAIEPAHCVAFLDAWQADRRSFAHASRRVSRHPCGYDDAFAALGIKRWQEALFGVARMPATATVTAARPGRR
jgi:hypothetical protein